MKRMSFLNRSSCTKAANKMRELAKQGGLEDLDTLSEKVVMTPYTCLIAADFFDTAKEKGGAYFCNIIKEPIFTIQEINVIIQHLDFRIQPKFTYKN